MTHTASGLGTMTVLAQPRSPRMRIPLAADTVAVTVETVRVKFPDRDPAVRDVRAVR